MSEIITALGMFSLLAGFYIVVVRTIYELPLPFSVRWKLWHSFMALYKSGGVFYECFPMGGCVTRVTTDCKFGRIQTRLDPVGSLSGRYEMRYSSYENFSEADVLWLAKRVHSFIYDEAKAADRIGPRFWSYDS